MYKMNETSNSNYNKCTSSSSSSSNNRQHIQLTSRFYTKFAQLILQSRLFPIENASSNHEHGYQKNNNIKKDKWFNLVSLEFPLIKDEIKFWKLKASSNEPQPLFIDFYLDISSLNYDHRHHHLLNHLNLHSFEHSEHVQREEKSSGLGIQKGQDSCTIMGDYAVDNGSNNSSYISSREIPLALYLKDHNTQLQNHNKNRKERIPDTYRKIPQDVLFYAEKNLKYGTTGIKRKTCILLETWQLTTHQQSSSNDHHQTNRRDCVSSPPPPSSPPIPQIYKQMVLFFRSLHAYLRLGPVYELAQKLSSSACHTTVSQYADNINTTSIRDSIDNERSQISSVTSSSFAANEETIKIKDNPYLGLKLGYRLSTTRISPHHQINFTQAHFVPHPSQAIAEYNFDSIPHPSGSFSVHVMYRTNCDFILKKQPDATRINLVPKSSIDDHIPTSTKPTLLSVHHNQQQRSISSSTIPPIQNITAVSSTTQSTISSTFDNNKNNNSNLFESSIPHNKDVASDHSSPPSTHNNHNAFSTSLSSSSSTTTTSSSSYSLSSSCYLPSNPFSQNSSLNKTHSKSYTTSNNNSHTVLRNSLSFPKSSFPPLNSIPIQLNRQLHQQSLSSFSNSPHSLHHNQSGGSGGEDYLSQTFQSKRRKENTLSYNTANDSHSMETPEMPSFTPAGHCSHLSNYNILYTTDKVARPMYDDVDHVHHQKQHSSNVTFHSREENAIATSDYNRQAHFNTHSTRSYMYTAPNSKNATNNNLIDDFSLPFQFFEDAAPFSNCSSPFAHKQHQQNNQSNLQPIVKNTISSQPVGNFHQDTSLLELIESIEDELIKVIQDPLRKSMTVETKRDSMNSTNHLAKFKTFQKEYDEMIDILSEEEINLILNGKQQNISSTKIDINLKMGSINDNMSELDKNKTSIDLWAPKLAVRPNTIKSKDSPLNAQQQKPHKFGSTSSSPIFGGQNPRSPAPKLTSLVPRSSSSTIASRQTFSIIGNQEKTNDSSIQSGIQTTNINNPDNTTTDTSLVLTSINTTSNSYRLAKSSDETLLTQQTTIFNGTRFLSTNKIDHEPSSSTKTEIMNTPTIMTGTTTFTHTAEKNMMYFPTMSNQLQQNPLNFHHHHHHEIFHRYYHSLDDHLSRLNTMTTGGKRLMSSSQQEKNNQVMAGNTLLHSNEHHGHSRRYPSNEEISEKKSDKLLENKNPHRPNVHKGKNKKKNQDDEELIFDFGF